MYAIVLFKLTVNVKQPDGVGTYDYKEPLVKKIYVPVDFFVDSFQKEINLLIETEKINLMRADHEFRANHLLKLKGQITEVEVASLQIII